MAAKTLISSKTQTCRAEIFFILTLINCIVLSKPPNSWRQSRQANQNLISFRTYFAY
jgi:hypothetical protein